MSSENTFWEEHPALVHDIRDGLSTLQVIIIALGALNGSVTAVSIAFICALGIQGFIWKLNPVRVNRGETV